MSFQDNCDRDRQARNARTLAACEAKHNEPPNDFLDSPDFEDAKLELWDERMADIHGYMIEAITELPDEDLKILAHWIMKNQTGAFTTAIGAKIAKRVVDYCEPEDYEVIESLDKDENV